MNRIIAIVLLLVLVLPAAAQNELPLQGPLLALNSVERDEVLLYDVGTDTLQRLNFGPLLHDVWGFAPDGCSLLVTLADGTQPARLYRAGLDGAELLPLIAYDELPPDEWGIIEAQWSPDGNRIAFVMERLRPGAEGPEWQHHIASVPAEGGEPSFYSVTGREFTPRWSPAGDWLAYVSYDERAAGADPFSTAVPTAEPPPDAPAGPAPVLLNEADLWIVSADGETKYRLTAFPTGSVSHPRWSPDGDLISFVYSPSASNDTLWMIGASPDARPTQLSTQWSLYLDSTWLPDSTAIIAALRDFRETVENRLWQVPLVGLADENAIPYLPNADLISADYPRFSPDGRWLAVRSAYDLVLVDVFSGEARIMGEDFVGNTPAWWASGCEA